MDMFTLKEVVGLLLGSAVLNGLISGLVNGWFNGRFKRMDVKESRIKVAAELTRLSQERTITAGANTPGATVTLPDPAVVLSRYLEALDEIAKTGRWKKGEDVLGRDRDERSKRDR